jgi:hemerythrin
MDPLKQTSELIWQDAQHRVLFTLLDQLAKDDSTLSIMHRLTFYAESHFAIEEEYMARLGYPGEHEHRRAHDRFREELRQMMQQPEQHDQATRELISTFLTEWLKRHVLGIDKRLEAFILKSGGN